MGSIRRKSKAGGGEQRSKAHVLGGESNNWLSLRWGWNLTTIVGVNFLRDFDGLRELKMPDFCG
ncbi:MAG: hypothetical protein LWW81_07285 [Rhodocyclales bacterium]|nr:hypothetical protein [Rhodocyclales bacterium]